MEIPIKPPMCAELSLQSERRNKMRVKFTVVLVMALTTILAKAGELKKISLDNALSASPKIESDAQIKAEGSSSIRITTKWPTTVFLEEVSGPKVENAKLMYSAKVKAQLKPGGTAFLELWAHVGGGQYFSRGMNDAVSGTMDWKTIQTPFMFRKGQTPDKLTLNLVINGKGTVWVDDIVLSAQPLE
jgi:hypothetical protein